MPTDHARSSSRSLFLGLRDIDFDTALRDRFRRDPQGVLHERGLDSAFADEQALADFVATFAGLEGEAWLATFHSFLDWLEGDTQDAPALPHVTFSLDAAGNVESVANRGATSRSQVNPFYSRERADSSASDVVAAGAPEQAGPAVTIFDGYETSPVSAELGRRYVSRYYQRTMIKHHVRTHATQDGPLRDLVYRDLTIRLDVSGDPSSGVHVAGATAVASPA